MGLAYVKRKWLAPGGWDGPGFSGAQVTRFETLMCRHARVLDAHGRWVKPVKGRPALVASWDDGRGKLCWYEARCGAEERALYQECVRLFGQEAGAADV